MDFVLVEFFFFGNGWVALVLALVFTLTATRPSAPQLLGTHDELYHRYHSGHRRGTSS